MTQEVQGTKMGRSSRTAETSVARTARTGRQQVQPPCWPAHSPEQGCHRRDLGLPGVITKPAIHMHLCLGFTGELQSQKDDTEELEVALSSGRGGLPA